MASTFPLSFESFGDSSLKMKVKDIFRCLLFSSCILTMVVMVYWRQHMNPNTTEIFQSQNSATETLKEPLLKQCNEGYYFSQMNNSCIVCEKGSFSLKGWIGCLSWLDCESIERDVRVRRLLSKTSQINAVKHIFLADWYGYDVVYMKCAHKMFWEDFANNAKMLQGFQGSDLVVQLIGTCDEKHEIITTFYRHGSADKLNNLLPQLPLSPHQELGVRLQLAKDYVRILHFLHNSPLGVRVMCDTNDLVKTLSQFLVTDELHLVVNDLDALPEVDHKTAKMVKCGHRQLHGWFVAPEQLWPFDEEPFSDSRMQGYDEKIDIWRIPDVVIWFLGDSIDGLRIKASLKTLFGQCKRNNKNNRPTAHQVLQVLEQKYINFNVLYSIEQ